MEKLVSRLKEKVRRLKLHQILMLTFSGIFITAIVVIVMTSVVITGKISTRNYSSYSSQLLAELRRNLEYITNDVETKSRYIISDASIQDLLLSEASGAEYNNAVRKPKEEIIRLIMEQDYIESVSVYDFQGRGFTVGTAPSYVTEYAVLEAQNWYPDLLEMKGKYLWTNSPFVGISMQKNRVVFGRAVNERDTLSPIGMLIITLDNEYLNKLVDDLSSLELGNFFIANEENEIMFGAENVTEQETATIGELTLKSSRLENFQKEGGYYVTSSYVSHLSWNLLCLVDQSVVMNSQIVNSFIILLVSVIVLLVSFFIYNYYARAVTRTLGELNEVMERAEDQDFREEIKIRNIYEFIQLGDAYNRLMNRIHKLINEVLQEKLNAKQAQLESLQAQVNPHFLYNTLDCINWKAMTNEQVEISEMIQGLSQMFRFSLGTGENDVTLLQEVDNVRNYLMLQKKRYEERLVYLIDIPDSVMNYRVMKFLLQPLVENSILHGIGPKDTKGYVSITAEETEEVLCISVMDNGVGVDMEQITAILSGNTYESGRKRQRHGIYIVNERLKMRYGEESALHFSNRPGGGTKVWAKIAVDKLKG